MSYQAQTPPAQGSRRKGLLGFGVLLLLGGVGAGAALFVSSGSQYEDAVKSLQRAPVGCDTEFEFTGTGTFIFYAETKGEIGDLRGDCDNTGTDYSHDGRVRVDLVLTNSDGDEVDLTDADGASYDKAGFVGTEVNSVSIDEPGTYTLSVQSDDDDFAIAVGRNPKDDYDSAQTTAIIVAAAGVVLGGLFIILGLRRKAAPAGPAGFQPGGFPPAGPGGYNPAGYNSGGPPASPPGWTPAGPPAAPPNYGAPAQPYGQPPAPPEPNNPWSAPQQ